MSNVKKTKEKNQKTRGKKEKVDETKDETKEAKGDKVIPTRPVTPRPLTPRPLTPIIMNGEEEEGKKEIENKETKETENKEEMKKDIEINVDQLIERELEGNGYIVVDRVMERYENGDGCIYVKTINPNGHVVFVEMDVDGYIYNEKGSFITERVENANSSLVPTHSKMSAMECAKSDVCGVLFECADGICTLTHKDHTTDPEEFNFRRLHSSSASFVDTTDAAAIYPIVRMSEIRYNPALTLKCVESCTKRLTNKAQQTMSEEQERTYLLDTQLQKEFSAFKGKFHEIHNALKRKIEKLEYVHHEHIYNKHPTEKSKQDHKTIQRALTDANAMMIHLSSISHQFSAQQTLLRKMVDDTHTLVTQLKEQFPTNFEKL